MLIFATLLSIYAPVAPQDPPPPTPEVESEQDVPPPSPDEGKDNRDSKPDKGPEVEPIQHVPPAEALKALEDAVKEKDPTLLASTVQAVGRTPDKDVAKKVASFLRHKDPFVRMEAVKALRYNEDPSVLAHLLRQKKNKAIIEDPEVGQEYIYALGQHADKKALPILTDDLRTSGPEKDITRAKVISLGRIRETASVEALMSLMTSSRKGNRRRGGGGEMPFANELRTSLAVLTGEDLGTSSSEWQAWWNDSKKKFKVDKEEPTLPRRMQVGWTMQWLTPEERDSAKKRVKKALDGLGSLGGEKGED